MTIKDVAREAGVSPSTVSNVLNGRTDAMTEETLTRIRYAIQTLKYRPNNVARGLVTRRTATFGLILSEIETPLFLQALNLIEPIARDAGYNILMSNARGLEDERKALDLLQEKQVDGIIFFSISEHRDNQHLLDLQSSGIPLVLINRSTPLKSYDQINWDNAGGVFKAVNHLVQLGHRLIAHLRGPLNRRSSEERLRGFQLGLQKYGIEYREDYVRLGDYTGRPESWQVSIEELLALSPRPTAIIASDDVVAASVIKQAQNSGLRVPRDISVIGIDNAPFCSYLNPSLTTVELPVSEAGKLAIEVLLDRIASQAFAPHDIVVPCPLIVRESSGAAPS